ncbi:MAG TPA: hypothetical protein VGS57_22860, partial [Thermoanaerobaculia bacterium]|nr:hypothetical protein [Thermoanaerobaculia bacterium]
MSIGCAHGWHHSTKPPRPAVTPQLMTPEAPRVDVPGPTTAPRHPLTVKPDALPPGGRARFPAFDGDSFHLTLPVRRRDDVSAQQVLDEVIAPLLRAVGFERGVRALQMPPAAGLKQPVGDFKGLAQAVADEYAANPRLKRRHTQEMIDVFLGRAEPSRQIDRDLEAGEGMTFAQYVAGLERLEIEYPFQQVDGDVPIEHTLLVASRWQGQGITSAWGSLISRYVIGNARRLAPVQAGPAAVKGLHELPDLDCASPQPIEGPFLVLLPYRTVAGGNTELRYAYRMLVQIIWLGQTGTGLVWVDADDGKVLKFISFLEGGISAAGATYNRDPGIGTTTGSFQVDAAMANQYTLQLAGFSNRVDYQGDGMAGFNATDVNIADSGNGSSGTFANFNQAPINDPVQALCAAGTNKGFEQVSFFSILQRDYRLVTSQGIFTPFPTSPFSPQLENPGIGCNGNASMTFGACGGYTNAMCPNFADGTTGVANMLNTAHDNTWIGHELGHSITPRLTSGRPANWCGMPGCAIPVGWGNFHDLCDAWSAHFENTNCWSGWFAKNLNGANGALNCLTSSEGGWSPRLSQVTTPFNPGAPGDHFPEHRAGNVCGYCDMQVAAAALWEVRVGMRSKCRPSGMPQYGVRFQRALKETGFLGFAPNTSDLGSFQSLLDLETKMAEQWITSGSPMGPPAFAHNGPHTTNKVTAGFARAGIFLVPYQCLDGNAGTHDPAACASTDIAADAVIDIDDNEPGDDLTLNGVNLPEFDYLRAGGPAPTFRVWTGPRYRLDGAAGASSFNNPAPC